MAGEPMDSLALTTVRMWNSGSEAIRGDDLRNLRVTASGSGAAAWVGGITSRANAIRLDDVESEGEFRIYFDFLNPGDGVEIAVLHSDIEDAPSIAGDLVGARLAPSFSKGEVRGSNLYFSWTVLLFLSVLVPVLVSSMIQFMESDSYMRPEVRAEIDRLLTSWPTLTTAGLGFLMWATGFVTLVAARVQREGEPGPEKFISPDGHA
jgi:hypothetical protein